MAWSDLGQKVTVEKDSGREGQKEARDWSGAMAEARVRGCECDLGRWLPSQRPCEKLCRAKRLTG